MVSSHIGARIKLSIVATLTITGILAHVGSVLPQVSYIKLADWYLIISVFFVYFVFAEFTLVNITLFFCSDRRTSFEWFI